MRPEFLSTLSLRRATIRILYHLRRQKYFYPRSPCGERLAATEQPKAQTAISIHALLAESDANSGGGVSEIYVFLSTLSLRRATCDPYTLTCRSGDFYPRSPCGERRSERGYVQDQQADFYPRSPCGERRWIHRARLTANTISIHALLAESDQQEKNNGYGTTSFLSTLSLRRATNFGCSIKCAICNFYPRSPCGERHPHKQNKRRHTSYFYPRSPCGERPRPRSTLMAAIDFYPRSPCGERHYVQIYADCVIRYFYPRSPCGERLHYDNFNLHCVDISIHALLAESDPKTTCCVIYNGDFYPRSPCGERRST